MTAGDLTSLPSVQVQPSPRRDEPYLSERSANRCARECQPKGLLVKASALPCMDPPAGSVGSYQRGAQGPHLQSRLQPLDRRRCKVLTSNGAVNHCLQHIHWQIVSNPHWSPTGPPVMELPLEVWSMIGSPLAAHWSLIRLLKN